MLAITPEAGGRECFEAPVMHDVVVAGRKAAGGAQRRTKRGLLHQGSIQGARLEKDFPRRLAEVLSREVVEWSKPEGFEEKTARLTEQKYSNSDFLEGASL